jgi:prepilin signal peptidase PulO-like enzyme (type II secretory pathway)
MNTSEISTAWKLGYALLCAAVTSGFNIFSQSDRGLVAGLSVAVIVLVAKLRWDARDKGWFWVSLCLIAIAHLLLVFAWDLKIKIQPTILVAPFAMLDFYITITALFLAETLAKRWTNER